MVEYRCHYVEDGRRDTVVVVEAESDAAVFLQAEKLLAESGFVVMEILQGKRFVGRVPLLHLRKWRVLKGRATHQSRNNDQAP